jgi:hypothetical protein
LNTTPERGARAGSLGNARGNKSDLLCKSKNRSKTG